MMKGTLATAAALAALALAGCDQVEIKVGGEDETQAPAEPTTSSATTAKVRKALALYAADVSLASNRAEVCEKKVEAGEYFDYDECYLAEIRPPATEAEAESKAILASVADASPRCRKAIASAIQDDWLTNFGPDEGRLVKACQAGE